MELCGRWSSIRRRIDRPQVGEKERGKGEGGGVMVRGLMLKIAKSGGADGPNWGDLARKNGGERWWK